VESLAALLNCEHPASLKFRALISEGVERPDLVRG